MSTIIVILAVVLIAVLIFLLFRKSTTISTDDSSTNLEAQRLAKLLISEIKLYNQHQVAAGRKNKDLYRRLQKEIDRARGMYDQRINRNAPEQPDYFHDALVRELANGDVTVLGAEYRQS